MRYALSVIGKTMAFRRMIRIIADPKLPSPRPRKTGTSML
jgi:hypothetical protein